MKLFDSRLIITFDDVAILPGFSEVEPFEIDVSSRVSSNIRVSVPLVSSPMDYVTNAEVAKFLARLGALGVIHRHCSIDEQVQMVKEVKNWDGSGFPAADPQDRLIEIASKLRKSRTGVMAILDDDKILGIIKYIGENFATSHFETLGDALDHMRKILTASIIVGTKSGDLLIEAYLNRPLISTKTDGKFIVGAAISPFDKRRVEALDGLADVLVVDIAHYHTKMSLEATRLLGDLESDLVIGNIGTYEAAEHIITSLEKVDGFRVGIGSGSICITSEQTGVFAPTLFATSEVYRAITDYGVNVPIIADGGIRSVSDALKAMVFGASSVMCGRYIAGCHECPGKEIEIDGKLYKPYRGMGSTSVRLERLMDRYSRVTKLLPEGIEGLVPYQGSIIEIVHRFVSGLRVAMGYAGAKNIDELKQAKWGILLSGVRERGYHDVIKMKTDEFLELRWSSNGQKAKNTYN